MKNKITNKSVNRKLTFLQATQICISILENKLSSSIAKKEAKIELTRFANELDRIDNLTN